MKRTVRLDSGAWSLLKNAAVRASASARSSAPTVWPKLPAAVALVATPVVRNTARGIPVRSATAITSGVSTEAAALITTVLTSAAVSGAGGGGESATGDEEDPPPQPKTKRRSPGSKNRICLRTTGRVRLWFFGRPPGRPSALWDDWNTTLNSVCRASTIAHESSAAADQPAAVALRPLRKCS